MANHNKAGGNNNNPTDNKNGSVSRAEFERVQQELKDMLNEIKRLNDSIEQLTEQNQKLLEENKRLRKERSEALDDIDEDDDEEEMAAKRRKANKKAVAATAISGGGFINSLRGIFQRINKKHASKDETADLDDDELSEAVEDKDNNTVTSTTARAASGRETSDSNDEPHDADESDDESEEDMDDEDDFVEDRLNRKKGKWGRRLLGVGILGLTLTAAAVGIGTGQARKNNSKAIEKQAEAITALQDVDVTEDNVERINDDLDKNRQELQNKIDKNYLLFTNPSDESIAKGEKAIADTETLSKSIDELLARKQEYAKKADALGVTIDQYAKYESAAKEINLPVERVKELAEQFGVPVDKLNTSEAQAYMRDSLASPNNVNEKYQGEETPQAFAESMLFVAANNKAVLAQYITAMDEDGGIADAGVDGLEMPVNVNNLYQKYLNDDGLYKADLARLVQAMQNAEITSRTATDRMTFSYYINGDNQVICSYSPENSGGETTTIYQVVIKDVDGNVVATMLVKNGCYQLEAGREIVVSTSTAGNPNTTPTVNPPAVDPPTELKKKDPTQDSLVNPENPNQTDKAPATEENQKYPDKDSQGNKVDQQDAANNGGNINNNPSDGSEVVPEDQDGNIGGHQNTTDDKRPNEQDH